MLWRELVFPCHPPPCCAPIPEEYLTLKTFFLFQKMIEEDYLHDEEEIRKLKKKEAKKNASERMGDTLQVRKSALEKEKLMQVANEDFLAGVNLEVSSDFFILIPFNLI